MADSWWRHVAARKPRRSPLASLPGSFDVKKNVTNVTSSNVRMNSPTRRRKTVPNENPLSGVPNGSS